jgi:hypothetical protein
MRKRVSEFSKLLPIHEIDFGSNTRLPVTMPLVTRSHQDQEIVVRLHFLLS